MSQSQIESLLRARIGLSIESIGAQSIASAIRTLMTGRGFASTTELLQRLESDAGELAELIEEVVVPESWFFRGVEAFRNLTRFVYGQWQPASRGKVLRVLSIPCAAGEEPFSIAMTLLSAGLEPHEFRIDGVDISRRVLDRARLGVYGEFSFRETELEFQTLRDRYFVRDNRDFRLREELKGTVNLLQGNLVDPLFLLGQSPYDVIFCRNLFIYLDVEGREAGISAIHRLLAPNGVLYMGHAEPIASWDPRFRAMSRTQSFAFCRSDVAGSPPRPLRFARPVAPSPKIGVNRNAEKPRIASPRLSPVQAIGVVSDSAQCPGRSERPGHVNLLENAARHADAGRLDEAAADCRRFLDENGPDAEAYCLLGVIRQAAGDLAAAEQFFNKALYLSPAHHESLVHMMLIASRRGDERQAANFRRRAAQSEPAGGRP